MQIEDHLAQHANVIKSLAKKHSSKRHDREDVPPKFRAEISLSPSSPSEVVTVDNIASLIRRAMEEFSVPASAGLLGELSLTFRWE